MSTPSPRGRPSARGRRRRAAALVLAAGRATRFGSDKLAAPLAGKPLLQHVLDVVARAALVPAVAVLAGERASIQWHGARPVVNPAPEHGLASSLALGLRELAREMEVERVVVLLADQPLVSVAVIQRLLAEPADRPIVVPRYAGQPGNPVLLERPAWPLAEALGGDRGMSQLFNGRPDLVRYVDVPGVNPDVDTPADLAALDAQSRRRTSPIRP